MVISPGYDDFTASTEKCRAADVSVVNTEILGFGGDKEHITVLQT